MTLKEQAENFVLDYEREFYRLSRLKRAISIHKMTNLYQKGLERAKKN